MSDQTDHPDQIDSELRSMATAAFDEHEGSVSATETTNALGLVRARIAAGDHGGSRSAVVSPIPSASRRRVGWVAIGALTAAAAVVLGVIIVRDDSPDKLVPGTTPTTLSAPTTPPSTAAPDPTAVPPTELPTPTTATTDAVTTTEPVSSTTVGSTGPPTTVEPPAVGEVLAIPKRCVDPEPCTQLDHAQDGRLVAYEPVDETLNVYDSTGVQLQFSVALAEPLVASLPYLIHLGPDDVVYFLVDTPNNDDPSNDLIAIPLMGDRAGTIVQRYTGLDGSGDSALVPTADGLAVVDCCGFAIPRPDPAATTYRFVDRNGVPVRSGAPVFRLSLGDTGSSMTRIEGDQSEHSFALPTVFQYPRDFPQVTATADGGALAADLVQLSEGGYRAVVRFDTDWPDNGIDNADVFILDEQYTFGSLLLEPTGTVVIDEGDRFVRYPLEAIGTAGWPDAPTVDFASWTVSAPGLNDYVAANQPAWAAVASLFGLQLMPSVGANETVLVDFDQETQVISITRSGLLDDSVVAVQFRIQTERGPDGLLRFVSGTIAQQCALNRGQQNFASALCR
ncbi:MAG: hypothetical protein ABIR32_02670 [Ilumatobacteraceae bacterium]